MIRRPPRSTRTDTLFPYTTLFRSDSTRIAEALSVSVTPVRDSLYRLTGERMVDFTHGEGFHVHRLTETELRDMLELNLILLLAAIATARGQGEETSTERSEERRVGKECGSTCRLRWSPVS